jgi:hypothetical protein
MTRWPPSVWLLVAAGSLLVLIGYNGQDFNPEALIPGAIMIVGGLALALWLAFGRWGDRPSARGVAWLIPATVAFYVLAALAGLLSEAKYALAAICAGMIPLTAATLLVATTRAKTVGDDDAREETTAGEHGDPFPGVGMDDETPLGDTPEHSDAERVARPDRRFEREPESRTRR